MSGARQGSRRTARSRTRPARSSATTSTALRACGPSTTRAPAGTARRSLASVDRVRSADSSARGAVAEALARQQEARGGAQAAAERARRLAQRRRRRDRDRPAAGALRRTAVRALQGPGRDHGRRAAAGAARAPGGARVLGRVRRPRLRRDPLDHACSTTPARCARCATRPRASPSGQPASRVRPRRDDHGAGRRAARGAAGGPAPRRRGRARRRRVIARAPRSASAFARSSPRVFPDLVVLDPVGSRAQDADGARPVARARPRVAVVAHSPCEAGQRLLAAGYHQQVPVRDGFFNLFLLMDGERRALAVRDGGVEVRGLGARDPARPRRCGASRAAPADWSPGVLLRPLAQDLHAADARLRRRPAEIAYHAQIGPSYAHFGITRPIAAAAAQRHGRRAGAGARARGRGPQPVRPAGRPRGRARALGARGAPRGRGGVRRARATRS